MAESGELVELNKLTHFVTGLKAQGPCDLPHFSVYTCQRNCLFTVTILVNINDTPDPHLLIEKLGVGIAKLPLSDGLNYLNWCQRHSESLKIVCDAEQRHIPLSRG